MMTDGTDRFEDDDDEEERDGPGRHIAPPVDTCNGIYLALVLAGVGFLLPYNSFTIAVDYFLERYPRTNIVFDISIVYVLVAFGAVLISNLIVEMVPLNTRIIFGYIVSLFMLLFVSFFEIWWPDTFPANVSYTITLISVAVAAVGCTVQQSSFYGYTSMLPKRYTQAVMTGESTAGLIISANRIITKLLLDDERLNTLIFFVLSIFFIVICLVTHIIVQRTRFIQFYMNLCNTVDHHDDTKRMITLEPAEDVGLTEVLERVGGLSGSISYGINSTAPTTTTTPPSTSSTGTFHSAATLPMSSVESFEPPDPSRPNYRVEHIVSRVRGGYSSSYTRSVRMWSSIKRGCIARWEVSKKVWHYMVSIALAYFITLCLYPGIVSEVVSCHLRSWMPVIMMALFNLFDFIGKIAASIPYDWTRRQLLGFTCARVILVPLMMFCAAPRTSPIFPGELPPLILSSLLGLTNGVLGSVPMILAPTKVPDELRELTGNIMTLSYYVGLTIGGLVAYDLKYALGASLSDTCGDQLTNYELHLSTLSPSGNSNATSSPFTHMQQLILNATIKG
ncbi:equilibrative nucleoside transporter 3 isoform X2 [Oratosquilla oratoria]|uniref:equilibrative nucleoside transporter 3 isoform X2 n=1 Tax=Oratosquilla oratoria TaxID=337810 RepID=UPI003F76C4A9